MRHGAPALGESGAHGRAAWLRHVRGLARELAALQADVICLQEVDDQRARTGYVAQAHELARQLKMQVVFADAHGDIIQRLARGNCPRIGVRNGYGVAILSRYPVRAARALRLPDVVKIASFVQLRKWRQAADFRDAAGVRVALRQLRRLMLQVPEPRVCLYCELDVHGERLVVANAHISPAAGAGAAQLRAAIGGLRVFTGWRDGLCVGAGWKDEPHASAGQRDRQLPPALLAGDFNMTARQVTQVLASDSRLPAMRSLGAGDTFPRQNPRVQIDYVLGGGGVLTKPAAAQAEGTAGKQSTAQMQTILPERSAGQVHLLNYSDHAALSVDIALSADA